MTKHETLDNCPRDRIAIPEYFRVNMVSRSGSDILRCYCNAWLRWDGMMEKEESRWGWACTKADEEREKM